MSSGRGTLVVLGGAAAVGAWLLLRPTASAEAAVNLEGAPSDAPSPIPVIQEEPPSDIVIGTPPLIKALTGQAGALPSVEQSIIFDEAERAGVDPVMLAAIRLAENGRPGREFGVLSVSAPTYREQARIAATSIRNNMRRFQDQTGQLATDALGHVTDAFIAFMGARWAPVGADNDPRNLNSNWVRNVTAFYHGSQVAGA